MVVSEASLKWIIYSCVSTKSVRSKESSGLDYRETMDAPCHTGSLALPGL